MKRMICSSCPDILLMRISLCVHSISSCCMACGIIFDMSLFLSIQCFVLEGNQRHDYGWFIVCGSGDYVVGQYANRAICLLGVFPAEDDIIFLTKFDALPYKSGNSLRQKK